VNEILHLRQTPAALGTAQEVSASQAVKRFRGISSLRSGIPRSLDLSKHPAFIGATATAQAQPQSKGGAGEMR
jgi:hypothetical protein